jgi:hypothetical protein
MSTYWYTGRDAPPPGEYAVVLGVGDSVLHLIVERATPTDSADPVPGVTVKTERDEPLRWRHTSGFESAAIGGRNFWVAVFDLPPPECECLSVSVTAGGITVLAVRVYGGSRSIEPQ